MVCAKSIAFYTAVVRLETKWKTLDQLSWMVYRGMLSLRSRQNSSTGFRRHPCLFCKLVLSVIIIAAPSVKYSYQRDVWSFISGFLFNILNRYSLLMTDTMLSSMALLCSPENINTDPPTLTFRDLLDFFSVVFLIISASQELACTAASHAGIPLVLW